jgi:hypothetical protein
VSGSADGSIRIWANPPARDPAAALCAKLTTNMNDQQWKNWVSDTVDYQTAVCPGLTAAASTG